MEVKEQQLKPDMEQQTGYTLGTEYIKAVYCQPAYLTYLQTRYPGEEHGNPLQYLVWRIPWVGKEPTHWKRL